MPPTTAPPTITTTNLPEKKHFFPISDMSIIHFPPGTPTPSLAFIRTSPQTARRPPQTIAPNMPRPFRAQARNVFENLTDLLAQAGATPHDITRLTIYLGPGSAETEKASHLDNALREFLTRWENDGTRSVHRPPVTFMRDQVLGEGYGKIEADAEAVVRLAGAGAGALQPPGYDSIW